MRLPFGLDLKSIIVGVIIAYFVVPRVMALFNQPKTSVSAVS
jgi:hypothetical protein